MPEWVDVGSVEDVRREGRLVARVNGREVGVVSDGNGALRGIRNVARTTAGRSASAGWASAWRASPASTH